MKNRILYILELTVGYETNLTINSDRKHQKYLTLIANQENVYDTVKFVNVSVSSLGVFDESTSSLFYMLHDLKYDEQRVKYQENNCYLYSHLLYILQTKQRVEQPGTIKLLSQFENILTVHILLFNKLYISYI